MDAKVFNNLSVYLPIYEVVSKGAISFDDLKVALKSDGSLGDSTIYKYVKELRDVPEGSLFEIAGDMISINLLDAAKLVEDLINLFGLKMGMPNLNSTLDNQREKRELSNEIARWRKKAIEADKDIELIKKGYEDQIAALKKEIVKAGAKQKILLVDTIATYTKDGTKDRVSPFDFDVYLDPTRIALEEGGVQRTYLAEMDPKPAEAIKESELALTEQNYIKRAISHVATKKFLSLRIKKQDDKDTHEEILSTEEKLVDKKKHEESKSDARVDARYQYVLMMNQLLKNQNMTDQEKLAVYAYCCDYHNSDMEVLLNFAGDNNINANLLIQVLETPGLHNNVEATKNFLRQLAKSSELKKKQEFARELICGEWYIVANYNGKDTKFQLLPIDEINQIRKELLGENCGDSANSGNNTSPAENNQATTEKDEETDEIQQPSWIHSVPFDADQMSLIVDDIQADYDLSAEAIDFADYDEGDKS